MNLNTKNHYIPQFYLKNWSKDEQNVLIHRLIVSDENVKKWEIKFIKGIGYYSNLYVDILNGNKDDQVEKWLNNSVETPAKEVLDKVVKGDKLTKNDYDTLTRFVFAQHVRTPKFFKNNVMLWKDSIADYLTHFNLNNAIEIGRDAYYENVGYVDKNAGSEHLPIRIELIKKDEENSVVKIETDVGKGYWLFAIKQYLTNTINILPDYKWSIFQAPVNFRWVTSDNPVVVLNYNNQHDYDFKGGWGKTNCNIICPISPYHLLITQVGTKLPSYFTPTLEFANEIQKLLIENADEFVISLNEIEEISKFRNRIINKNYENSQRKLITDWIQESFNAEKHYNKKKL